LKKLLLTGFGPFDKHPYNPSQELVCYFHNQTINEFHIFSSVLPVEYETSIKQINLLIEEVNPCVVINIGLAHDRKEITPELIAINYQHSEIADNAGVIKKYSVIDKESYESFFSTLPLEKIISNLENHHLPVKLSSSAGTYVCNSVMYQSLRKIHLEQRECLAGFIHIPSHLDQTLLQNAIRICIQSL
jgi:pyroglutamyl-peptidase